MVFNYSDYLNQTTLLKRPPLLRKSNTAVKRSLVLD